LARGSDKDLLIKFPEVVRILAAGMTLALTKAAGRMIQSGGHGGQQELYDREPESKFDQYNTGECPPRSMQFPGAK